MNKKGLSLIELIAAVSLVIVVVAATTYFLPKAMTAASSSRYITTAKNLAAGEIQTLKQQPYDNISATGMASFPVVLQIPSPPAPAAPVPGGCDCSSALVTATSMTNYGTVIDNNVTFTKYVCVNLVNRPSGGNWTTYCPATDGSSDTGLKNIHVWVTWKLNSLGVQQGSLVRGGTFGVATTQQSVDMESVVGRQ